MKRTLALAAGWALIALGVVGLFLPVLQGLVLVAAGLLVLSRSSERARAWMWGLRRRWPRLDRAFRRLERAGKGGRGRERGPGETAPPGPEDHSEGSAGTKTGSPEPLSTTEP